MSQAVVRKQSEAAIKATVSIPQAVCIPFRSKTEAKQGLIRYKVPLEKVSTSLIKPTALVVV